MITFNTLISDFIY